MKSRIEKKTSGPAWLRVAVLVLMLGQGKAQAENRPGSAAHARRPGVAERFRLDVAREVFRTQAAKFEQGLANNREWQAFVRGEPTTLPRETVDTVLREYTRLVSTDPSVATEVSRLSSEPAVRARYQQEARRDGIQTSALVAAGQAEAAAVSTRGNTAQNQAMLRLAETFAQRGQFLSGAFANAARQIETISQSATTKTNMNGNPTQQALGNQMRSLLAKAAGHPESLGELNAMLPLLEGAGIEAPRMLRGFELTVDLRDITSNGTKNGDPYKAMAKSILGATSEAAPGVNELASRIAANERQLQQNTAAFERVAQDLQVPAKFLPALREHLQRKGSLAEVVDAIDEMLARTSMTANERTKLLELKDYYAAQRLLMALHLAERLRGTPKDKVTAAKCITKAASLTSQGAILGAKAALTSIFALMVAGGQATAADVAEASNDVASFMPASSLSAPRSATAAVPPPASSASSVATRPTHGGAQP